MGVSKINVGTVLRRAFITTLRDYLRDREVDSLDPGEVTSTGGEQDMLASARARVAGEIARLMAVFGCVGKAGTVQ